MTVLLRPFVVRLFFASRPSAISRFVMAVWVGVSVDRVSVLANWARTHVLIEGLKGLAPALAHRDATTAVAVIHPNSRVEASLFHRAPRHVFRGVLHAVLGVIRAGANPKVALGCLLGAQASATLAAPITQGMGGHILFASALTATAPLAWVAALTLAIRDNGPSAERCA